MGDKGGRSRQIHAREGNGRGSGRPRRRIATRGPRDATPPSSPGRPRRQRRRGRGGGLVRSGGGGGRTVIHAGTTRTLVPVLSIHACGRFSLLDACGVCTVRAEGGGKALDVSPVSDRVFESIDRRVLHMREMQPTDLHTWSSTRPLVSEGPSEAHTRPSQASTGTDGKDSFREESPDFPPPRLVPQTPRSTRAPPGSTVRREITMSAAVRNLASLAPTRRRQRPAAPLASWHRRPRGEERRRPAQGAPSSRSDPPSSRSPPGIDRLVPSVPALMKDDAPSPNAQGFPFRRPRGDSASTASPRTPPPSRRRRGEGGAEGCAQSRRGAIRATGRGARRLRIASTSCRKSQRRPTFTPGRRRSSVLGGCVRRG